MKENRWQQFFCGDFAAGVAAWASEKAPTYGAGFFRYDAFIQSDVGKRISFGGHECVIEKITSSTTLTFRQLYLRERVMDKVRAWAADTDYIEPRWLCWLFDHKWSALSERCLRCGKDFCEDDLDQLLQRAWDKLPTIP